MARHVTESERNLIEQWLFQELSYAEIARRLNRHRSTISREVKRNGLQCESGGYLAFLAHSRAECRRLDAKWPHKVEQPNIRRIVESGLAEFWSPQQIAGRMKREKIPRSKRVCCQTIYNWIDASPDRDHWRKFLRRPQKRTWRTPSEKIDENRRIENRLQIIEKRQRLGDFEGDTVLGKRRTGGLVTMVDRKSRLTVLAKIKRKKADLVDSAIRDRLRRNKQLKMKSLTLDNGSEFARMSQLEETDPVRVYWAKPGCPHQRGTNENTNGLLRQFFPKGTDFSKVSPTRVKALENLLNNRPRKCLGYRTPNEIHYKTPTATCCNSS